MFIFLYTVFRNSSISDEHVFCVALHFTIGRNLKCLAELDIVCFYITLTVIASTFIFLQEEI